MRTRDCRACHAWPFWSTWRPRGAGSPLHVHRREDEWFYVLEGELTFWVGGEVIEAPAGAFVYGGEPMRDAGKYVTT